MHTTYHSWIRSGMTIQTSRATTNPARHCFSTVVHGSSQIFPVANCTRSVLSGGPSSSRLCLKGVDKITEQKKRVVMLWNCNWNWHWHSHWLAFVHIEHLTLEHWCKWHLCIWACEYLCIWSKQSNSQEDCVCAFEHLAFEHWCIWAFVHMSIRMLMHLEQAI